MKLTIEKIAEEMAKMPMENVYHIEYKLAKMTKVGYAWINIWFGEKTDTRDASYSVYFSLLTYIKRDGGSEEIHRHMTENYFMIQIADFLHIPKGHVIKKVLRTFNFGKLEKHLTKKKELNNMITETLEANNDN